MKNRTRPIILRRKERCILCNYFKLLSEAAEYGDETMGEAARCIISQGLLTAVYYEI